MSTRRPAPAARWFLQQHWTKAPLVALDFETTGLDLKRDAIISFGAAPIVGGRIELERAVYREVRPLVPPSAESIAVHHLRPVDLQEAPSMEEARNELRAVLDRRFIVAWVAEVEASFLSGVFGGSGRYWLRRTIDAFRLARALERLEGRDPADGGGRLDQTAERYGVPVEETHHALDDAVMTAELFLVLAAKLAARGDGRLTALRRAARRAVRS
jgi:DNA polymerase III subunit epsilon